METIECALHTCFEQLNPVLHKNSTMYAWHQLKISCVRYQCIVLTHYRSSNSKKKKTTWKKITFNKHTAWFDFDSTKLYTLKKRTHIETTPFLSLSHFWRFCTTNKLPYDSPLQCKHLQSWLLFSHSLTCAVSFAHQLVSHM